MLKIRKTVVMTMFFLIPMYGISYSAPTINSVSGSFFQGSSVSLNGTGFGIGDTTPIVWDDFEDGTVGQNLSSSPKIGSWELNSKPRAQYTNQQYRSGSKASIGSSSSGDIFTQFGIPGSGIMNDTYYYVSWWGKYNNPCSSPGQVKMIQLWGTYKVGDYNPGFFYGGGSSAYMALENSGMKEMEWPSIPRSDQWHFFELILKQSDVNVANGSVQVKVDNSSVYNKNNVKTRERSGESWERFTCGRA